MESIFRHSANSYSEPDKHSYFHGVWCSLLLPLAYTVTSFKTPPESYSLIVTSLLLGSYSIYFAKSFGFLNFLRNKTSERIPVTYISFEALQFGIQHFAVITTLGLILSQWLPIQSAVWVCISLAAYISYLPRLFLIFPKSFTFGEGCLVLQSLIIFVASSVQSLERPLDQPVSISKKLNK